jgi:hypothetical protein
MTDSVIHPDLVVCNFSISFLTALFPFGAAPLASYAVSYAPAKSSNGPTFHNIAHLSLWQVGYVMKNS